MNKDVAVATWHDGPFISEMEEETRFRPFAKEPELFWWGCFCLALACLWEFLSAHFAQSHSSLPIVIVWSATGFRPLSFASRRVTVHEENLLDDPADTSQELISLTIKRGREHIGRDRGVAEVCDGMFVFSGHRTAFCFGRESLYQGKGVKPISYKYRSDEIVLQVDGPFGETTLTLIKLKQSGRKYQALGKDIYRPEPSFAKSVFDLPDFRGKAISSVVLPPADQAPSVGVMQPYVEDTPYLFGKGLLTPRLELTPERRLVIIGSAFLAAGLGLAFLTTHNWDISMSIAVLALLFAIHLIRHSKWPSPWLKPKAVPSRGGG